MSSVIELWIGAHHVSARLVHRRWLRPEMMDAAVSAPLLVASTGAAVNDNLLQICIRMVEQLGSKHGLRVIVSDSYCRYMLLPRPIGSRNRMELDAAISARFQTSFGDNGDDWVLRTDSAPNAQHDLVCALRRNLHDSLHKIAAACDTSLFSVQPLWVWCAEQSAPRRREDHWLLTAEGNVLTAGLFRAGQCIGLRSSKQFESGETLENILMRESSLYTDGGDTRQIHVFGNALTKSGKQLSGDFTVVPGQLPDTWERTGMPT